VAETDREDDARAVRLCLEGDRDAFAKLVERYQQEILLYCHSQILNLSVAEELAQDTFLRAFERLRQLKTHDRFRPWLYRIAATAVLTYRRRRRSGFEGRAAPLDITTGRVEQFDVDRATDMAEIADDALRCLSEGTRAAVVLRVCEEMSYRAIAERLHLDPATAETRVRRGLASMRAYLARVGRDDEVRDVLRYGIAGTLLGSDIVSAVMESVARMPDPGEGGPDSRELRTSAALALALVSALFVGIGSLAMKSQGADAPDSGLRSASLQLVQVSAMDYGATSGPHGMDIVIDGPHGAFYDFESGDLTGWTARHHNRRLDRFHEIAEDALLVQKHTLDNPVIPGSRGLRFRKHEKGAYLQSVLTSPEFGPFTDPFVAEWDVLLGDDIYGMYLAERAPSEADSEAQVMVAGVYFSRSVLTAIADGYPRLGSYAPDALYHVRLSADPGLGRFSLTVQGDVADRYGASTPAVLAVDLPFAGAYERTGLRRLVFAMGRAADGMDQLGHDSQMILDNIAIRPASAPAPDVLARVSIP
jgi:RNA polymerase sigma-70 factor, ECF subfamily